MKTLLWDEKKQDFRMTDGWIAISESDTIEIIGQDGKVHYRRPYGHPDVLEAIKTEGVTVRVEQSPADAPSTEPIVGGGDADGVIVPEANREDEVGGQAVDELMDNIMDILGGLDMEFQFSEMETRIRTLIEQFIKEHGRFTRGD